MSIDATPPRAARTDPPLKARDGTSHLFVLVPYLWLVVFFLVPFLVVLKISLSHTAIAQPPYVPVLDLTAGFAGIKQFLAGLSAENFRTLVSDTLYVASYFKSLQIATISTLLLL